MFNCVLLAFAITLSASGFCCNTELYYILTVNLPLRDFKLGLAELKQILCLVGLHWKDMNRFLGYLKCKIFSLYLKKG